MSKNRVHELEAQNLALVTVLELLAADERGLYVFEAVGEAMGQLQASLWEAHKENLELRTSLLVCKHQLETAQTVETK